MARTKTALLAITISALVLTGCSSAPNALNPRPTAPTLPPPSAAGATASSNATASGPSAWLGYHADQARTGAVAGEPSLSSARPVWAADLGGAVYGQPVVANGRIIAATESNRVVALDPASGKILWDTSLGAPLTAVDSVAGCGNIDPLGVTSTPAIDAATGTVYVVGEVSESTGAVHHQLEGLRITTGAVTLSENVDPPLPAGESAVHLLQRASLAIGNGHIYIGYGGNYGDCGDYHGWVVSVNETGAADPVSFEAASDGHGGAIWESGGAAAIDTHGNVYITTGNANPDPPEGGPDPLAYTESVVKLSPTLVPLASFKDRAAGGDEDLSTGNPVLLPDGTLFTVGKTDIGYVLSQQNLSLVASIPGICGSDPDGGPAYDAATRRIFVPCRGGGIQQVDLADGTLGPKLSGANGAPIVIGTELWAAQYPDGTITEFDLATDAPLQTLTAGSAIPTFASPSTALGLLLIGTTTGVTAFRGAG
ncbi:MAG: PQQ-binding-like beta-propeller repeat protein [Microbacteriaceae bacterium]